MTESHPVPQRTHYCGEIGPADADHSVVLTGWAQGSRDHGGIIFIDLRDRTGLAQVVVDPSRCPEAHALAESVRSEYVLAVQGKVALRPKESINRNLPTGTVEVFVDSLQVLNPAKTPPFAIEDGEISESLRLQYRYLDLRRPQVQRNFLLRHRVLQSVRAFLSREGFLELETPILTRSTPEGARDYLVPSRVNKGRFYALPQSPQLFKQLLMVSGFDRYFQICRCFRDEDLRADRQPEFTQIDVEMSFVEQEDVLEVIERLMAGLFQKCLGVEIEIPFKRYSYREALALFGSDKPDLRYESLMQEDVTDLVKDTEFEIFRKVIKAGGKVKGFSAPQLATLSRKNLDDLTKFAIERGAGGLAWMKVEEGGLTSPIVKFFKQETLDGLRDKFGANTGDLLLMVADQPAVTDEVLAALRAHVADLYHLKTNPFGFAWVTDFPLLERNEEEKRFEAVHHPFTASVPDDVALFETSPERVRSQAYDLVLNGQEIGGGSIRIHQREVQERMFSALGISAQAAKEKFGFLLEALEYGTPPHGGIALGLDRIVAIMAGVDSIRDVIPFPKTQRAIDMMMDAPSPVEEEQLKELGIDLKPPD